MNPLNTAENKIVKIVKKITTTALFFLIPALLSAQVKDLNKYGLWVINKPAVLSKMILVNPKNAMLDVKLHIEQIELDLKYCTKNNFMHEKLYPPTPTTYLRQPAIAALAVVQKKLNEKGLGLKIWDAYRPYSVTEKMWELVKDDRYAADPKSGSGHNRGVAVDLTIINLANKEELDMGTSFDNFSDTAHVDFKNLPAPVLQNRELLKTLMEENGFIVLDTEWWHFYLADAKKYELLNLSFKQLAKMPRLQIK